MKEVEMVARILAALLFSVAFVQPAPAETFVDGGTQMSSTHVCGRSNAVMKGAHVGKNLFLCTDQLIWTSASGIATAWFPVYIQSDVKSNYYNGSKYQSHGMAACPPGFAMAGFNERLNILACVDVARSAPSGAKLQQWVDGHTQFRTGSVTMHACPGDGSFMVGIHVGKNLFLCGRYQ
ncbi:hypothetical protein RXV86_07660 [Alisedimentitalea sp. MJ-SS2]|uniref:hypothetical protein n=1 Tax=Aliisedimentitalea sp. MJ-SS2 TaxID=3049795 RepID=UPI0029132012|nr:hypothetical protein [Alisedimentitalea sp. MJ-SS2]MDU8927256.1 hypothetical protein [Alisedimentitalea sp. MJ-SS2]